jgi:hypothetical protein
MENRGLRLQASNCEERRVIKILILILIFSLHPLAAGANPFRGSYVCLPPLNPNAPNLEFQVREGQDCQEGEQLARVVPQNDGSIFLLPTDPPLSQEGQNELEEFKKYYGIER